MKREEVTRRGTKIEKKYWSKASKKGSQETPLLGLQDEQRTSFEAFM
jgi:hypothetical protein